MSPLESFRNLPLSTLTFISFCHLARLCLQFAVSLRYDIAAVDGGEVVNVEGVVEVDVEVVR